MVRHRKNVKCVQIITNNETASSSSASSEASTKSNKAFHILSRWKTGVGVICLLVAVYVSMLGYLETRVNTPFDDEKVRKNSVRNSCFCYLSINVMIKLLLFSNFKFSINLPMFLY